MENKLTELEAICRSYESALIAFSGGVDSALVLKVARDVLGREKTKAVTAQSASLPERELAAAREFARLIDADHEVVQTREMEKEGYAANAPDRCYFCKETLYEVLVPIAKDGHFHVIANGANLDDLGDHRPGLAAAREFGVESPLVRAGFTKEDVRRVSKELGLPTWNKEAQPCLASRLPYGERVTEEKLARIERAEYLLKDLGFCSVRVRHHGETARIEVARAEMTRFFEPGLGEAVLRAFKSFGFRYVTLDLEGFRSGSLNSRLGPGRVAERSEVP